MTHSVLIAIGGNQPFGGKPPEKLVLSAVERLADAGVSLVATSKTYRTPAFPAGSGLDFVNGAVKIEVPAAMTADELMLILHQIERDNGRERIKRWGARTLDLDLVAFGDQIAPDLMTYERWRGLPLDEQHVQTPDQLILPHPRLHERAFVLVPLLDVAADWLHPVLKKTVRQMVDELSEEDRAEVREIA